MRETALKAQWCSCEESSRSELGCICDNETIARVVLNNMHVRKDGSIKPSLFTVKDVTKLGTSLFRLDHMSEEEVKLQASAVAAAKTKPPQTADSIVSCLAANVRAITDNKGDRLVSLFDDPTEETQARPANPAHALAIAATELPEGDIVEIRTRLSEAFQDRKKFEVS